MKHKEIIDIVLHNLGYENPSAKERLAVKNDVYNVITILLRKSEGIKKFIEQEITTNDSQLILPEDLFEVKELVFISANGNTVQSKEIEYEKFMKWNTNLIPTSQSFSEIVTETTPVELFDTVENEELDGYIGYTLFDDDVIPKLLWKPSIDGTIKIYCTMIPFTDDIEADIEIHKAFRNAIESGATVKGLVRKMVLADSDVKIFALNAAMKEYKSQYTDSASDFMGYVNRRITSGILEQFDFLNDRSMIP